MKAELKLILAGITRSIEYVLILVKTIWVRKRGINQKLHLQIRWMVVWQCANDKLS